MISVAEYGSYFIINLDSVVWRTTAMTMFSLRMIDVQSGDLLTHSDSRWHVSYPFAITRPNLPRIFEKRVEAALKPIPAT